MKITDITSLSKNDVLAAIGLASKRTSSARMAETLAIFSVGLLVGASMALVLAPKPGQELRQSLSDKIRRVKDKSDKSASEETGSFQG